MKFINDLELPIKPFLHLSKWGFETGLLLAIIGLFAGEWLLSAGLIMAGSAAFLHLLINGFLLLKERVNLHPYILFYSLLTISTIVGFIASQQYEIAWIRFKLYAAFLLIPLLLLFAPKTETGFFKRMVIVLVSSATIAVIFVTFNFYQHLSYYLSRISQGGSIDAPVDHIRFILFVSVAFLASVYGNLNNWFLPNERKLLFLMSFILLMGILILSVRTGWVITFLGSLIILLDYFVSRRKIVHLLFSISGLFLVFYLGIHFIPSAGIKVGYMIYDLTQYMEGNGSVYSDARRLYSLQGSLDILKGHWLMGIGSGDIFTAMEANAKANNYPLPVTLPHNQFLFTALCSGIIGLTLFFLGLLLPLMDPKMRSNFLVKLLVVIYLTTMMIEPTFETSVGILSFVLFIVIFTTSKPLDLSIKHPN